MGCPKQWDRHNVVLYKYYYCEAYLSLNLLEFNSLLFEICISKLAVCEKLHLNFIIHFPYILVFYVQATEEDYEKVPIEQFGLAVLRGMGWKDGDGVGRMQR